MTGIKGEKSKCNFCNRTAKECGHLVTAEEPGRPKSYICRECAENAKQIHEQEQRLQAIRSRKPLTLPSPREVYEHLNRYVVGQDVAKRRLAVTVVNHYKRLHDLDTTALDAQSGEFAKVKLEKSNVLLLGPTGVGKTLLAKSLAEILDVPFAIGDATTITEAGYVGEDVENLLLKLLRAADFDVSQAERGIIYIDEIDKIRKTGGNVSLTRDVSGEGVQQSLLKLIEGTTSNVPPQGGRKHPEQQYIQIDTTNILFIVGGAFVGLDELIANRVVQESRIGFNSQNNADKPKESKSELLAQVEQDDLEKFGLIPELVGRLAVVTPLQELSEDQLQLILTGDDNGKPESALLKQFKKIASYSNVRLHFTDDAVTEIAKKAKAKGTGARALRAVVENLMADILFDLSDYAGMKLVINADVVKGLKSATVCQIDAVAA